MHKFRVGPLAKVCINVYIFLKALLVYFWLLFVVRPQRVKA